MTGNPLNSGGAHPPMATATGAGQGMTRRLTAILAVTCAVAVGNIYFPQAVVPLAAAALHVPPAAAGAAVTATQVGYMRESWRCHRWPIASRTARC